MVIEIEDRLIKKYIEDVSKGCYINFEYILVQETPIMFMYADDCGLYINYVIEYNNLEGTISIISKELDGYDSVLKLIMGGTNIYKEFMDASEDKMRYYRSTVVLGICKSEIKNITMCDRVEKYKAFEKYWFKGNIVEDMIPENKSDNLMSIVNGVNIYGVIKYVEGLIL